VSPRASRAGACAIVAALCMGAVAPLAPPKVSRLKDLTLKESTQTYVIAGRTAAEIGQALREHGVIATTPDGYRNGYVWQLEWQLTPRQDKQACKVADLGVQLTSVLTQPQWNASGAPAALAADWSRFATALRAHQAQHRTITVTKAQQLRGRVMKLTAKTCDSLKRGVDYVAQGWIDDMRKQNDDYDARTRHGETENVRWPTVPAP
jgi:predicted secreted Zn-dependent protease